MIKAILFDYDDTLVQTRKTRYQTIYKLSDELFKTKITEKEIDEAWGLPAEKFLLKLFGRFSSDIHYLWSVYLEFSKKDLNIPHIHAFDFINKYQNSFKFGIVTSSSEKVVFRELNELQIDTNLFLQIQTSDHTSVHKPNPKVFEPIFGLLKNKKINKDEVIYIGDSPADYESASKFGFQFLGIAHDNRHVDYFQRGKIPFVKSFFELENDLMNKERFA
ncbi:HAD-IA family hydrolase [Leptospira meyeri]|uniref:phosphoglycolate phosphatase n=1 Tax=Leptospira meyeri TaxID=29508 RepID=A0A4R8MTA7_LEPME|nr:HAD-IA family hydrolase [Leptospira meyeri]EKJ87798.1 haloacid dehalogenase-like hydrolase [Leptospira meyeri serovar Hardjo str. Went 5]EMJ89798.1 haloacid dehalogenase-like hydrolase [Leptospira meyeri serovar Semaranga str. Veldrot Semarang 173]TDY72503.1 HAD superfamily hydrolase (TIGR01549 family) [Leptospira meyeri]